MQGPLRGYLVTHAHPCRAPLCRLGNVDYRMAAGLALGTALGGTLGSNAAVHAPPGEAAWQPVQPVMRLPCLQILQCNTSYSHLSTRAACLLNVWAVAAAGALETAFTLGMLFLGRKTLQSARR